MNVLLGLNISRPLKIDAKKLSRHTIADDFAFVGSAFMFAGDNIREAIDVKEREIRCESVPKCKHKHSTRRAGEGVLN